MRYSILVVLVALVSCKATSGNSQVHTEENDQQVFEEIDRVKTDMLMSVKLKNSSLENQAIINPMEKYIERNLDGAWVRVSVLYCDCGGPPCPAPPNERSIEPGELFRFLWDLMVEECKVDENGSTTLKERAPKGLYRATYIFKTESGEIQKMIIKFSL